MSELVNALRGVNARGYPKLLCEEAADALEWQKAVIDAQQERLDKQAPDQVELRTLLEAYEAKLKVAVEALGMVAFQNTEMWSRDCASEALARIKEGSG